MKFRLVACKFVTLIVLAGCCIPEREKTLPVTLLSREMSLWCWAASGEMIMEYMGASLQQCDEANKQVRDQFGNPRVDCCNDRPSACDNGGWPEFQKYGFNYSKTVNAALSWDEIKSQIYCKEKPFAFTWKNSPLIGGGGHMMVAIGYKTLDDRTNWVYINDPAETGIGDKRWIPYETYVSGFFYTHWDDYYDITKN